jgi:hypothetical protein
LKKGEKGVACGGGWWATLTAYKEEKECAGRPFGDVQKGRRKEKGKDGKADCTAD